MNTEKEVAKKAFHHFSKAKYYDILKDKLGYVDRLSVGLYYKDGGCICEFEIAWKLLGNKVTASVRLYDDAWPHIDQFSDILMSLKEFGSEPNVDDVVAKLLEFGYVDFTK